MVAKKVASTPKDSLKKTTLTKTEQEILNLITEEFLTVKQMCLRRKCSHQRIYKIIKNLKRKGAFNIGLKKVAEMQPTMQPNYRIRLHGQEFNIKILWQDHSYQRLLKNSNLIFPDGNTVRLYKNSIEIYSGHSFYGENGDRATKKSLIYWLRFFTRIEHDLRIIIVKPRSANIKLVNQHYASMNSEICESAIERGERIRVFAEEDGKLAFITDDSFGFKEDETVHPVTAKQDRKAIDKQVNDWRRSNPPTQSELSDSIMKVTKNQLLYAQNIESHIRAIQDLGKGVRKLTKIVEKIEGKKK